MTDLERSMMLERSFADVSHEIFEVKSRNAIEAERARKDGREPRFIPMDELIRSKNLFRAASDAAFIKHKATHPINDHGVEELAFAIMERAALDYELALCSDNEYAGDVLSEIEEFAEKYGSKYTTLDFPELLERICEKHERFVNKAHRDIESILDYVVNNKSKRFRRKKNPNKCPLCGGGMYIKGSTNGKRLRVVCTSCELSEYVPRPS